VAALSYRLHALKALSDWHYRQLCVQMSKQGYRTQEPAPTQRETSQVLNKVFRALRQEGIGKAQVARDLRLHVRDLDQLVFNLAMLPIEGENQRSSAAQDRPPEPLLRLL
jgi:hypothetical protein